jgi:hypothetical protein
MSDNTDNETISAAEPDDALTAEPGPASEAMVATRDDDEIDLPVTAEQTVPSEPVNPEAAAPAAGQPDLQEIDLAEIDAYLKTLVPGVLSMSENLVQLGEKFRVLNVDMKQRVAEVDNTFNRYNALLVRKNKLIQMIMIGSIGAVLISLTMMFIAGLNFTSQVNKMNALSISLARRLSDVNSGLVTFEQLNQSIGDLSNRLERMQLLAEVQTDTLREGVAAIDAQLGVTATQMNESMQRWQADASREMTAIITDNRASATGIVRAIEQMDVAQRALLETTPALRELLAFRDQLSALIVLERNRYLDAISAAQLQERAAAAEVPAAEPEPPLQFRRISP